MDIGHPEDERRDKTYGDWAAERQRELEEKAKRGEPLTAQEKMSLTLNEVNK